MLKKSLIAASLLSLSLTASANWQMGAGYTKVDDGDVTLGGVFGTLGYEFSPFENKNITVTPEFRIGAGVEDDTLNGLQAELSSFYQVSARVAYDFENDFYAYATPSYNRYRANLTGNVGDSAFRASTTDNGWGLGAGVGYKLTEKASAELSYERIDLDDELNVWSLGFKYTF